MQVSNDDEIARRSVQEMKKYLAERQESIDKDKAKAKEEKEKEANGR